jgi:hypothetical protein
VLLLGLATPALAQDDVPGWGRKAPRAAPARPAARGAWVAPERKPAQEANRPAPAPARAEPARRAPAASAPAPARAAGSVDDRAARSRGTGAAPAPRARATWPTRAKADDVASPAPASRPAAEAPSLPRADAVARSGRPREVPTPRARRDDGAITRAPRTDAEATVRSRPAPVAVTRDPAPRSAPRAQAPTRRHDHDAHVSAHREGASYRRSSYYARNNIDLSYRFGTGPYCGRDYFYPWHHGASGTSIAFFFGTPLTYAYVPYGFYCDAPPVYVTRYEYVTDVYPVEDYEIVEAEAPSPQPYGEATVEPAPAAGSPEVEEYLRNASEAFRNGEYYEAAQLFRLAALGAPDNAAPLFALGQALLSIGELESHDAYAARVIRRAVVMSPGLLKEPGDIIGVYRSPEEFDRVLDELRRRAEASPLASDARFLLAVQRFFSGAPQSIEDFRALRDALPGDEACALFLEAAEARFALAADLPPILRG